MQSPSSNAAQSARHGFMLEEDRSTDRELILTRFLEAPPDLVWSVWTDPRHLGQWWGPHGFTTTTRSIDIRPGGGWRFVMHGPDGRDYENRITYVEIDAPRRLVYAHGGDIESEPVNFRVEIDFEPSIERRSQDGGAERSGTRVTMRLIFQSSEAKEFVVREYNAFEGAKQMMVRLGSHLASERVRSGRGASEPFTISRVFDAPRSLVFRVWTERGHLMQWFGPKGTSMVASSLDLRPGGHFHYGLRLPDGSMMWARWAFREIVRDERIVFVLSFSDEQGGVTRAPFEDSWPLEMLTTATFAEHAGKGGGTVVTLTSEALSATDEEQGTFDRHHESMRGGWSGTFDALTEHLTKQAKGTS